MADKIKIRYMYDSDPSCTVITGSKCSWHIPYEDYIEELRMLLTDIGEEVGDDIKPIPSDFLLQVLAFAMYVSGETDGREFIDIILNPCICGDAYNITSLTDFDEDDLNSLYTEEDPVALFNQYIGPRIGDLVEGSYYKILDIAPMQ